MIEAIFFDLDGVLVDAQEWHYEALNKALVGLGYPAIERGFHLARLDGLPTRKKLEVLTTEAGIFIDKDQYQAIFNLKQHYTMTLIKEYCRPDPVKIEMMEAVRSYRKACVTNAISKTAYEMLVRSGLNYYMDYVQGNEATKFPKPNPAPYLVALSTLGLDPERVLVVEDSDFGVEAARRAGTRVLQTTYKALNKKQLTEVLK